MKHGQRSSSFRYFWENPLVIISNILIQFAFDLINIILELSQRCRWRLTLGERRNIIHLSFDMFQIWLNVLEYFIDGVYSVSCSNCAWLFMNWSNWLHVEGLMPTRWTWSWCNSSRNTIHSLSLRHKIQLLLLNWLLFWRHFGLKYT